MVCSDGFELGAGRPQVFPWFSFPILLSRSASCFLFGVRQTCDKTLKHAHVAGPGRISCIADGSFVGEMPNCTAVPCATWRHFGWSAIFPQYFQKCKMQTGCYGEHIKKTKLRMKS